MLSECKKINWLDTTVKIMSAVNQENRDQMEAMASELCKEYIAKNDELANKNDMTASIPHWLWSLCSDIK